MRLSFMTTAVRALSMSKIGRFCTKHSSQILIGVGVVSSAGTVVSTVIATKRSLDIIDAEIEKREAEKSPDGNSEKTKLKPKEVVHLCWKEWLVPAGFLAGSTAAYIGAFKIEADRAMTYMTLLGASETKLAALESEMVKALGEEKSSEIHDAVAQKIVDDKKISESPKPAGSESYKYRCYDTILQKEWGVPNKEAIELGIMRANEMLNKNGRLEFGDLLMECNCPRELIPNVIGRNLVWMSKDYYGAGAYDDDDVYTDDIRVHVGAAIGEDGEPIYILEYYGVRPKWDEESGLPFD